jgi:hypothetical protein
VNNLSGAVLDKKKEISAVANAYLRHHSGLGSLPFCRIACSLRFALGLIPDIAVHTFHLAATDQPPSAEAEGGQGQSAEQGGKQGQTQAKGVNHARFLKR